MQRLQSKQEELTDEEEMKQQQRMAIVKDLTKKIKGSMDAQKKKTLVGLGVAWRQIVKKHGPTQDGRIPCKNGMNGWNT